MKYKESSVLELKEQINADFKKEIIAFANTDGGEILVGVARDGCRRGGCGSGDGENREYDS